MQNLFKKYELELDNSELAKFQKFLEIFKEKNAQINLSAIRDDEGIIEKHFIDSIMLNVFLDFYPPLISPNEKSPHLNPLPKGEDVATPPPNLPLKSGGGIEQKSPSPERGGTKRGVIKVADLGTGGGFPLIPLAIINPEVQFTGIDSVGKKLRAIDSFAKELELENIKTLNGRAEDIGQNVAYREQFDFVTSRATAYMPVLLEYVIPLLKEGGIFCAYKLEDKEELTASKKALAKLGAKILKVKNYKLAGQDRTIIFIEKIAKTHIKYPRKVGILLQKPL